MVMDREILKEAYKVNEQLDKIEKQLKIWEDSEAFNMPTENLKIQLRANLTSYGDVRLDSIPFKALRGIFTLELNVKKTELLAKLEELKNKL